MFHLPSVFVLSCVLTVSIETALLVWLRPQHPWRTCGVVLLINSFTQPLAYLSYNSHLLPLFAIEVIVIGAEIILLTILLKIPWRLGIIFSVFSNSVTLLLALGWLWYYMPIQTTYGLLQPCLTTDQLTTDSAKADCIKNSLLHYSTTHPAAIPQTINTLWYLFQKNYITGDPRWFSPLTHQLGEQFLKYQPDPMVALTTCSAEFFGGCKHGIIMTYLSAQYQEREPTDWLNWCIRSAQGVDQAECVHGVGHVYQQMTTNLGQALTYCITAPDTTLQWACGSGVFMEYSLPNHHNHGATLAFQELPCDDIPTNWQALCYASAGTYRQYYPNNETFPESFAWCEDHAGTYSSECIYGVTQRFYFANGLAQTTFNE